MEEKMLKNQYHKDIADDEPFYFNLKKERKHLIGDGSDEIHLNIMLTSVAMMRKCEYKGVFHIDGTYKLIKNRFPVMVFGISDIRGKFFLHQPFPPLTFFSFCSSECVYY